jgi:hypothetical protein
VPAPEPAELYLALLPAEVIVDPDRSLFKKLDHTAKRKTLFCKGSSPFWLVISQIGPVERWAPLLFGPVRREGVSIHVGGRTLRRPGGVDALAIIIPVSWPIVISIVPVMV